MSYLYLSYHELNSTKDQLFRCKHVIGHQYFYAAECRAPRFTPECFYSSLFVCINFLRGLNDINMVSKEGSSGVQA